MSTPVSPDRSDAKTSLEALYVHIQSAVERLRSLTQHTVQSSWHLFQVDPSRAARDDAQALNSELWAQWPIAPLNKRQHIAWPQGRQVIWLGQRLQIPRHLNGYPVKGLLLRLSLTWWAEDSQIFVNGAQVQCGDLYDCSARILLTTAAEPGEEIEVAIRLVSPGHDDGALVKSVMVYETTVSPLRPPSSNGKNKVPLLSPLEEGEEGDINLVPEPGFVADELAVLAHYLHSFAPEPLERIAIALDHLPWDQVGDRAALGW